MKYQNKLLQIFTIVCLLTTASLQDHGEDEKGEKDDPLHGFTFSSAFSAKVTHVKNDKKHQYSTVLVDKYKDFTTIRISVYEKESLTSDGFYVNLRLKTPEEEKLLPLPQGPNAKPLEVELATGWFKRRGKSGFWRSASIRDQLKGPTVKGKITFYGLPPFYRPNQLDKFKIEGTFKGKDDKLIEINHTFHTFEKLPGFQAILSLTIIALSFLTITVFVSLIFFRANFWQKWYSGQISFSTSMTLIFYAAYAGVYINLYWDGFAWPVYFMPFACILQFFLVFGTKHPKNYYKSANKKLLFYWIIASILVFILGFFEFFAIFARYFFFAGNVSVLIDLILTKKHKNYDKYAVIKNISLLFFFQFPFLGLVFLPINFWYIPNGQTLVSFFVFLAIWLFSYGILIVAFYQTPKFKNRMENGNHEIVDENGNSNVQQMVNLQGSYDMKAKNVNEQLASLKRKVKESHKRLINLENEKKLKDDAKTPQRRAPEEIEKNLNQANSQLKIDLKQLEEFRLANNIPPNRLSDIQPIIEQGRSQFGHSKMVISKHSVGQALPVTGMNYTPPQNKAPKIEMKNIESQNIQVRSNPQNHENVNDEEEGLPNLNKTQSDEDNDGYI